MAHGIHLRATKRTVSIPSYVAAVRTAKANPSAMFKHGLETWWPVTGAELVAEYRRAAADRTNRHRPHYGKGRKWTDDWQRAARRVADNLNGRIITMERDRPTELRARLSHRLYGPDDL